MACLEGKRARERMFGTGICILRLVAIKSITACILGC